MSFSRRVTLMLRTGPPGSGKSHSAVMHLVDEWLPDHPGRVFTNLPLNLDAIADYVAGNDEARRQEVYDRIHLVPQAVEDTWLNEGANPAEYFAELEAAHRAELVELGRGEEGEKTSLFSGALILIDEAGKMWPSKDVDSRRKDNVAKVARWVSTLRHEGARLVLICQSPNQIAPILRVGKLAEVQLSCLNCGQFPDPITGVPLDHWLQLYAKFTGRYVAKIREEVYLAGGHDKMNEEDAFTRWLYPRYFPLYRSHNRQDGSNGREELMEWQRFGWFRFGLWFLKMNGEALGVRFAALVVVLALVCPPSSLLFRFFHWASGVVPSMLTSQLAPGVPSPAVGAKPAAVVPPAVAEPLVRMNEAKKQELIESANPVAMAEILAELEKERARRTELEARIVPAVVVLVDPEGVLTDEGDYLRVGKEVPYGALAGSQVVSVDLGNDVVKFDGDRVVRLRERRAPAGSPASSVDADRVAGAVSSGIGAIAPGAPGAIFPAVVPTDVPLSGDSLR